MILLYPRGHFVTLKVDLDQISTLDFDFKKKGSFKSDTQGIINSQANKFLSIKRIYFASSFVSLPLELIILWAINQRTLHCPSLEIFNPVIKFICTCMKLQKSFARRRNRDTSIQKRLWFRQNYTIALKRGHNRT